MKKFLFLALMACAFIACDKKVAPQQKAIIGKWSEMYQVYSPGKSLTFYEDGSLYYEHRPDTTHEPILTYGGDEASLNYIVRNQKLHISGKTKNYPFIDTNSFAFTTGYTIDDNILYIDSFSIDGSKFYKSLILYKQ